MRLLNDAHGMLLRYVMSLVANRHDAEDVLQRGSIIMWRRFGTYEKGTDFIAWATTVMFYEIKNFQRVTGRSRLNFDDELLQTLATGQMQHLRQWHSRTDALDACLQKLDVSSRELVKAIYTDGMQANEVARKHNCAPKTIYNKLNLIRSLLAECVRRRMAEASS